MGTTTWEGWQTFLWCAPSWRRRDDRGFHVCSQLEEDMMREKAEAEVSKETFCILGGSGKQAAVHSRKYWTYAGKAGQDEYVQRNLKGGDP